tara:strand:+ start:181 stop:738 length:558 start_codon:yes stop_codon:yes gene_type:complete
MEDVKIEIENYDYKIKPQEPEEKQLLLSSDQDGRKMILLIESTLSAKTQRKLNLYCSTYIIQPDENEKWLSVLPDVDIYICDIRTSLNWYLMNLQKFNNNFIKIYYEKIGKVREINKPILQVDYIRKHILKENPLSKQDLFDKLSSTTHEGIVEGWCLIFGKCLCSRITCCDCFSYSFKSCYSFF